MGNKLVYKGYNVGETTQVSIMPTATADNLGAIVQYVGATNANYINGYFYKCVSDGGITPAYSWVKIQVSDGGDTIQVETLPTAGASEVGNIYQYIGETNLSFTNGYFYECVEDSGSYSWVEKEVQKGDGTPHWTGTQAEYNAAASGIENGTIVNITDDYQEGVEVVDVIEEDNEGVPTSAAVYDALQEIGGNDWVECSVTNLVGSNSTLGTLKAYYSPSKKEVKCTGYFNMVAQMGADLWKGMNGTLCQIIIPNNIDAPDNSACGSFNCSGDNFITFSSGYAQYNSSTRAISLYVNPTIGNNNESLSSWIFIGSFYLG